MLCCEAVGVQQGLGQVCELVGCLRPAPCGVLCGLPVTDKQAIVLYSPEVNLTFDIEGAAHLVSKPRLYLPPDHALAFHNRGGQELQAGLKYAPPPVGVRVCRGQAAEKVLLCHVVDRDADGKRLRLGRLYLLDVAEPPLAWAILPG